MELSRREFIKLAGAALAVKSVEWGLRVPLAQAQEPEGEGIGGPPEVPDLGAQFTAREEAAQETFATRAWEEFHPGGISIQLNSSPSSPESSPKDQLYAAYRLGEWGTTWPDGASTDDLSIYHKEGNRDVYHQVVWERGENGQPSHFQAPVWGGWPDENGVLDLNGIDVGTYLVVPVDVTRNPQGQVTHTKFAGEGLPFDVGLAPDLDPDDGNSLLETRPNLGPPPPDLPLPSEWSENSHFEEMMAK